MAYKTRGLSHRQEMQCFFNKVGIPYELEVTDAYYLFFVGETCLVFDKYKEGQPYRGLFTNLDLLNYAYNK